MCLQERYGAIIQQKRKEVDALQKIASVGLYTDGDTSNSDYDLITDIDKINGILFSENLKYTGTRNIASASLGSFL